MKIDKKHFHGLHTINSLMVTTCLVQDACIWCFKQITCVSYFWFLNYSLCKCFVIWTICLLIYIFYFVTTFALFSMNMSNKDYTIVCTLWNIHHMDLLQTIHFVCINITCLCLSLINVTKILSSFFHFFLVQTIYYYNRWNIWHLTVRNVFARNYLRYLLSSDCW